MCTIAAAREFREIPANVASQFQTFLDWANAWAEEEIGCDLTLVEGRIERLSGDGSVYLQPSYWPVVAVDSIEIESLDLTLTVMDNGDDEAEQDVWLPPGGMYLLMRSRSWTANGLTGWPTGTANIRVTYDHGFAEASMPTLVKKAVCGMAWLLWQERDKLGEGARTEGDRSVPSVVRKLSEYPALAAGLRKYRRPNLV